MNKVLIVEDDEVVANIYRNKFSVEGYRVAVAPDGLAGLELLHTFRPDAVLLDLMLPKMTGVDLMKKIRSEPGLQQLPVIVFSNTYLTNLVEAAWKAGATKCVSKANCTPKQVVEIVRGTLSHNGASVSPPLAPVGHHGAPPHPKAPGDGSPASALATGSDPDVQFQAELRNSFIESLPSTLAVLRSLLQALIKADNEPECLKQIHELYRRLHALTSNASVAGVSPIARMSDALEALLKELHEKPANVTASTLRTVALAIDFLGVLFASGVPLDKLENPPPNILVVDDEAISLRAITHALQKAKLKSVSVEDPVVAFDLLAATHYDLALLDIDMPGMNGFELCSKLRSLPAHKHTPVVFVTNLNTFESRANSTISGGNDFIAKPFLFIELAVKALVCVFRARLHSVR